METKQVEAIQNIDKNPLMSNQQTVAHQPDKFVIDFKSVFPQFTPDNKPTLVINHKVILLDPFTAKSFLKTLNDNIQKYEEKFGDIKKPKEIEKAEKEMRNMQKEIDSTGTERPSYMG